MFVVGRNFLIVAFIFLTVGSAWAQQDPQFSMYMYNNLYNNPSYAGVEGVSKLSAFYRSQWLGYTPTFDEGGAPQSMLVSLDMPLFKLRSGAGLIVVKDEIANWNTLQVKALYSYHLAVGEAKLSFGLGAGIYSQTIDYDQYRAIDDNDPLLGEGRESQVRPDFSAGVFYRAEKYYIQLAVNHIVESEFDFGRDSVRNALENHLVFGGGYSYELNYDVTLKPAVLIRSDFNTYTFDLGMIAYYKEKFWGGASFRQGESVSAIIGYSFLKEKNLNLGYYLDYIISAQAAKSPTSHEIMLTYSLPVTGGAGKKIIRTPRFRH